MADRVPTWLDEIVREHPAFRFGGEIESHPDLAERIYRLLESGAVSDCLAAAAGTDLAKFAGWAIGRLWPVPSLATVDLYRAYLAEADLSMAWIDHSTLIGATLSGADLCGARVHHANLYGAAMRGCECYGVDLSHTNLRDVDLTGSWLCGARLAHADLRGAVMDQTDCRGADFRGASIDGATFYHADLHGADFGAAVGTATFRGECRR